MKFKTKIMLASAFFMNVAASPLVLANSGVINFTGKVTQATCDVNGGNGAVINVPLGTVPSSTLTADGSRAGMSKFSIQLTNCSADALKAATKFEGPSIDSLNGLLNLSPASTAKNVQIAIYDKNDKKLTLGAIPTSAEHASIVGGNLTMDYTAYFYKKGTTPVTPGDATATVNYLISYE